MKESKFYIYTLLVISMLLWGGTWVAGRMLAQSMHPMSAAFLRFFLASLFLVGLCRVHDGHLPRLRRAHVLPVLFLGLTGVFLYSYFFFTGLQTIAAGRAALIVACIPVCISALSAVLYKERFGPVRIGGTLLSLAGVALVIGNGDPLALFHGVINRGDLYILGCVASWTAYSLGGKSVMKTLPPLTAVTWSCVFGALMLLVPALEQGIMADALKATPVDWGCIAFLGILATGLAYYWYYKAILVIGASRSGIFINMVPVFAITLGCLILGEPVGVPLLTGGTMVVSGVYLTNRPS